jgi:hypothetical protein
MPNSQTPRSPSSRPPLTAPDSNIEPLPPNLRGGARTKVIEGLLARGLISDTDGHHLHHRCWLRRRRQAASGPKECPESGRTTRPPVIPAHTSPFRHIDRKLTPIPDDWNAQRDVIAGLAG